MVIIGLILIVLGFFVIPILLIPGVIVLIIGLALNFAGGGGNGVGGRRYY